MKAFFLIVSLSVMLGSCNKKTVSCIDIGNNIKSWSVYDLNDSIQLTDQFGNDTSFVITKFYNKPTYQMTIGGLWMKKIAACSGMLDISDASHFGVLVESGSSAQGDIRYPDLFTFLVTVGDASMYFFVDNSIQAGESVSPQSYDAMLEEDYAVGGFIYDQAIVCKKDTSFSGSENVYEFVYAKNKGLVRFSTRYPHKTWTIQ